MNTVDVPLAAGHLRLGTVTVRVIDVDEEPGELLSLLPRIIAPYGPPLLSVDLGSNFYGSIGYDVLVHTDYWDGHHTLWLGMPKDQEQDDVARLYLFAGIDAAALPEHDELSPHQIAAAVLVYAWAQTAERRHQENLDDAEIMISDAWEGPDLQEVIARARCGAPIELAKIVGPT